MLGAFVRSAGFWVLDFLTGCKKTRHYRDIEKNSDRDAEKKLSELLCYAKEHVPYYRDVDARSLQNFPVMKKAYYRQQKPEEFYSDEFLGASLHTVYTSGSTGTPFQVVQDPDKRNRTVCDLICCHNSIGWRLGDRYVFIRNWVSNYKQSKLKSVIQNSHNVNITGFDDEQKRRLLAWLKRHKHAIILGYASALDAFAQFLEQKDLDARGCKVRAIVCDSDALTATTYARLCRAFGCPVYNRYDNEENGLLGIGVGIGALRLNTSSIYFEVLKTDSDEPAGRGELGRVVLTDLYNKAMPLIRYDTGDLAVTNDAAGRIRTLESLCGRTAGCLTSTDGRLVSDVTISGAMEPFVGILKYQVVQRAHDVYCIKYMGELSSEQRRDVLLRMRKCFGENAEITLENVGEISSGPNGKYRTTINEVCS